MDLLALAGRAIQGSSSLAAEEGGAAAGLQINLFWVIVASLNFLVFAVVLYYLFGGTVSRLLAERRQRIEQGLRDAEQARRDRDRAAQEHIAALAEARREAQEILSRAQKLAQESREADIAATREELERMRVRAGADIDAEKQRALAELRTEVADLALAAASRVLGEAITDARQKRLVEEFLSEAAATERRG
ncbi:MAG TPA: F0F1 ATP synthase subunit B [Candidatus Limnocylindrales bacterium]|nr:F0F1 ATP synthase subunit B [Candidatus Limnocylindrales bacterium]